MDTIYPYSRTLQQYCGNIAVLLQCYNNINNITAVFCAVWVAISKAHMSHPTGIHNMCMSESTYKLFARTNNRSYTTFAYKESRIE